MQNETKTPELSQWLDPKATYLTIRKLPNGWVCEKVYFDAAENLVIKKLSQIGSKFGAISQFKIAAFKLFTAK